MTEDIDHIDHTRNGYEDPWPPIRGDYIVGDPKSSVAVVTLASIIRVQGCAIVGPCKTENLGLEKIVANVISNINIRILIICGAESKGHLPGNTLLALHRNGIDEQGRIVGSRGAIPFIQNLPAEAIQRFQSQVELVDCIGEEDAKRIEVLVKAYGLKARPYAKEPFQVIKKRPKRQEIFAREGDLLMGNGVVMDTAAWLVVAEG